MELTEDRIINAPRNTVWAALFDPEVLKACVPGCQELTGSAEDGFEAVVVQKVGPVKATFKGAGDNGGCGRGRKLHPCGRRQRRGRRVCQGRGPRRAGRCRGWCDQAKLCG